VIGCLYGLIAVGVVLVYRANRVVNFAQAGLGARPPCVALLLLTDKGVPYLLVLPVLILGALALGRARGDRLHPPLRHLPAAGAVGRDDRRRPAARLRRVPGARRG
jgi:branched-subunit amino acid ABC-type transport system permease component